MRIAIEAEDVGWAEVTLHIGLDTFRPVTVDQIERHKIHKEWCSLSAEVAHTNSGGQGRLVAGSLPSAQPAPARLKCGAIRNRRHDGFEGWADLFITPGHRWKVVDAMLTNFHLPRSTLLMMVSSFAGLELMREAYARRYGSEYRFYSFGDAMLII